MPSKNHNQISPRLLQHLIKQWFLQVLLVLPARVQLELLLLRSSNLKKTKWTQRNTSDLEHHRLRRCLHWIKSITIAIIITVVARLVLSITILSMVTLAISKGTIIIIIMLQVKDRTIIITVIVVILLSKLQHHLVLLRRRTNTATRIFFRIHRNSKQQRITLT